jgi:hypothetical protein
MKCVVALCLAGLVVGNNEPEPASFTTSVAEELAPAPAVESSPPSTTLANPSTTLAQDPEDTTAVATTTATTPSATTSSATTPPATTPFNGTTAAPAPAPTHVHTITLGVTVNNISEIQNEAALIQSVTSAMQTAAAAGANVTVVLHHITVTSTYTGLDVINCDELITAYAAMVNISHASVRCNNASHSTVSGARRLLDATMEAKITNDDNTDVVQKAKDVAAQNSGATLLAKLKEANPEGYANQSSITLPDPPVTAMSLTTEVTGTETAPTVSDIVTEVQNEVPGGAVATASVSTVTVPPATTTATTTASGIEDDHAAIAPMMTFWAVLYACAMN